MFETVVIVELATTPVYIFHPPLLRLCPCYQSPIIHGPDNAPDIEDSSCNQDATIEADVDGKGGAREFTAKTDVGDKQQYSIEDKLQVLADDLETRREYETHEELDRVLELEFSDAFPANLVGESGGGVDASYRPPPRADVHPGGAYFQPTGLKPTVVESRCTPPVPSYPFPPSYAHYAHPVDGAPLADASDDTDESKDARRLHLRGDPPNTVWDTPEEYVPSTKEAGTITFETVDKDFFYPPPSAPAQPAAPHENTKPVPIPTGIQRYTRGIRRLHGSDTPDGIHHYIPFGQLRAQDYQAGHDGRGGVNRDAQSPGFAVDHARRRLHAIRRARRGLAADNDSPKELHGRILRRSPFTPTCEDNTYPPPCDGAHSLLGRLKDMRRQYSSRMSR